MKYLVTFILLLLPTMVFAQAPDWVLGKGHKSFPDSKYLVGVGLSEKSPITASESARAELIKTIRVQVNSVVRDYNSRDKSISESTIMSEAGFLLEGSQVKDGWYDSEKKVFYSFVVIEKKLVLKTLKTIIDNIHQSIALMLRQGDTFFHNGDIIKSLVYYYDGYNESSKLLPYIQTYNSVIMSNDKSKYKEEYNLLFKEKILNIVDNINLERFKSNINDEEVDIIVKATFKGRGLSNFPVKIIGGYNQYVRRIYCDTGGHCLINTQIKKVINQNEVMIQVKTDLQTLEKHFHHSLKKELFGRLELLNVRFKYRRDPVIYEQNQQIIYEQNNPKVEQPKRKRYRNDIDLSPLRHGSLIRSRHNQRRGHLYFGYRFNNGNINILKRW